MKGAENSSTNALCVLNGLFFLIAIALNSITIHALRKTSLPTTLKTLLLSLTLSDLGVGVLVQPFFITLLVMEKEQVALRGDPIVNATFVTFIVIFFYASLFSVLVISADRFLAIHLHLRYQELVTYKHVVAVVISIWAVSIFFSLIGHWMPTLVGFVFFTTVEALCLIATSLFYGRIYLAVRRHRNQIQAQQQVQEQLANGEIANAARVKKSAVGTFYVYVVFLVCYLPTICINIIYASTGLQHSSFARQLQHYALTLVFLNSSLNPLIYCWKMKLIRHAIMGVMCFPQVPRPCEAQHFRSRP